MKSFTRYKKSPNQDTLIRLLEESQDPVYNVCYQVLRQRQDAEDTTQEVLIKICDFVGKFSDEQDFKRWLYRISFNAALDARRIRQRRKKYEEARAMAKESEYASIPQETIDTIQEHVGLLSDDLRCLVVEHFFERKTLDELSKERHCSTVAVWKIVKKAKATLRDSLTKAGFAGVIPFIDPMMKSVQFVSAPPGLITNSIIAKVVAVTGGTSATVLAIGGSAIKAKTIAAIASVCLAGSTYIGYKWLENTSEKNIQQEVASEIEHPDWENQQPIKKVASVSETHATLESDEKHTPIALNKPEEKTLELINQDIQHGTLESLGFKSWHAYKAALQRAILKTDDSERLNEICQLGMNVPNEAYYKTIAEAKSKVSTASELLLDLETNWEEVNPQGFIEWVINFQPKSVFRNQRVEKIIERWSEKDPDAAWSYVLIIPDKEMKRYILSKKEIKLNPEIAAETAERLPHNKKRREALRQVAKAWAGKDPPAATAWVYSLTNETEKYWGLLFIARVLAETDINKAIEIAQFYNGKEQQNDILSDILSNTAVRIMFKTQPGETMQIVKQLLRSDRFRMRMKAYSVWLSINPKEAAGYIMSLPASKDRVMGFEYLCFYRSRSPQDAYNWSKTLSNDKERTKARAIALYKMAIKDPQKAINLAYNIPNVVDQNSLIAHISSVWAQHDPIAAVAFAQTIPDEHTRKTALVRVSRQYARKDQQAAMDWAKKLPRGEIRDGVLNDMVYTISEYDIPNAASLLNHFSNEQNRNKAIKSIIRQGMKHNPKAVVQIADYLPKIDFNSTVRDSVGNHWAKQDPKAALAWVQKIKSEGKYGRSQIENQNDKSEEWIYESLESSYQSMIAMIIKTWNQKDHDAAKQWIIQSSLKKEIKDDIMGEMSTKSHH